LLFAYENIKSIYQDIDVRLGLIDLNDTFVDYNIKYNSWYLVYRGLGTELNGLLFGL